MSFSTRHRQYPPEQAEQGAHPSAQIQRQMGIIPEGHPKHLFIKQPGKILHPGAGQNRSGEEERRALPDNLRQQQDGQSAQPVDRTDRQDEPALAIPFGLPPDAHIHYLQEKTQKTVNEKIPEPDHAAAPFSALAWAG